jgi:hypothetical protein
MTIMDTGICFRLKEVPFWYGVIDEHFEFMPNAAWGQFWGQNGMALP